ncbi:MAG: hypothetical protein V1793_19010 [Pseudomonadota bacterium]
MKFPLPIPTRKWFMALSVVLLNLTLFFGVALADIQKVVILPFSIHAKNESDLEYLKPGIRQMLATRLTWKDRVVIADMPGTAKHLIDTQDSRGPGLASKIGTLAGADWVVSGSITEFAGSFSLDTAVLDPRTNTVRTFFGQASSIDAIIPEVNLLAARISQDLFGRKSIDIQQPQETRPALEPEADARRVNPETLLPRKYWVKKKSSKPFWKIWGKGDDDGQEIMGDKSIPKSKKPFWKFWGKDTESDDDQAIEDNSTEDTAEDTTTRTSKKPFWKIWGSDDSQDKGVEEIPEPVGETKKPWWKVW